MSKKKKKITLKEKKEKTDDDDVYLPEELVIQILSKQEVRDVLRCKSVCKSWFFLINSPSFIDQHLEVSKKKNNNNPYFLVNSCHKSWNDYFISIVSHQTLEVLESHKVSSHSFMSIVGSYNGIVCLRSKNDYSVHMWNPSTRHKIQVPNCFQRDHERHCYLIGFGFDAKKKDYKVVSVGKIYNNKPLKAMVYSLKTGLWTRCSNNENENFVVQTLDDKGICCSDGMYSWMAIKKMQEFGVKEEEIISFDMTNEKLISTPFPILSKPHYNCLTTFNGSLAVISVITLYTATHDKEYVGWVVGEYGANESWTKLFSIVSNQLGTPQGLRNIKSLQLLLIRRKDNEDQELVLFDTMTKQRNCFPNLKFGKLIYELGISFTESLVPIVARKKWVFRVKYNLDGSVQRYKARLMDKGTPGLDYDLHYIKTFSSVVN